VRKYYKMNRFTYDFSDSNIEGQAMNLVYSVVLMILSSLAIYFVYGRKRGL